MWTKAILWKGKSYLHYLWHIVILMLVFFLKHELLLTKYELLYVWMNCAMKLSDSLGLYIANVKEANGITVVYLMS
jgi:hypothetical protein